nr:MAG TPA: hypothetical protein [Caudoviricetes sp.]
MICPILFCSVMFCDILLCETNPLESLCKLQMYLASSRMSYILLSCAVLYCAKI